METRCVTCNADFSTVVGSTSFKCPSCDEPITRCGNCRRSSKPWKCPKCGFEGP